MIAETSSQLGHLPSSEHEAATLVRTKDDSAEDFSAEGPEMKGELPVAAQMTMASYIQQMGFKMNVAADAPQVGGERSESPGHGLEDEENSASEYEETDEYDGQFPALPTHNETDHAAAGTQRLSAVGKNGDVVLTSCICPTLLELKHGLGIIWCLTLDLHTGDRDQLNWTRVKELATNASETQLARRDSSDLMLGELAEKLEGLMAEKERKELEKRDNLEQLAKLKMTLAEEERQMREWVCV